MACFKKIMLELGQKAGDDSFQAHRLAEEGERGDWQ